jgi:CheY-like chemotaxis protein
MPSVPQTPAILVVEDEPSVRELFRRLVELEGCQPVLADTAERGFEILNSGRPIAAVMLDLKMPGMGGLSFLVTLRASPAFAHVPVAVITGDTFLAIATRRAIERLNADIHFKPLTGDELTDVITRLTTTVKHAPSAS